MQSSTTASPGSSLRWSPIAVPAKSVRIGARGLARFGEMFEPGALSDEKALLAGGVSTGAAG